ncbi:hypothetical protein STPE111643_08865 [Streptococcus penaeicida]
MRQKHKRKIRLVTSLLLLLLVTSLSLVVLLFKVQLTENLQDFFPKSHHVSREETKTVKVSQKKAKQKNGKLD